MVFLRSPSLSTEVSFPKFSGRKPVESDDSLQSLRRHLAAAQLSCGALASDCLSLDACEEERRLKLLEETLRENPQPEFQAPLGSVTKRSRIIRWFRTMALKTKHFVPPPSGSLFRPPTTSEVDIKEVQEKAVAGELDLLLEGKAGMAVQAEIQKDAAIKDPDAPEIVRKLDKFRKAGILSSYGVQWDSAKCVRDLLQNFYDGNGKTLDGTRIQIAKDAETGVYTVTLHGPGEYSHEMIEDIGATSKADNREAAGGFGEGAKILSLVMLRDGLADTVEFQSRNWAYDFAIDAEKEKKPLMRRLRMTTDQPGNRMVLTTKNTDFVKAIAGGIHYFKHSQNPDYLDPIFENSDGGFKYWGPDTKGNYYVANQRYEVGERGAWDDTLGETSIWVNHKPLQRDRDRMYLDMYEVRGSVRRMVSSMDERTLVDTLFRMEPSWAGHDITGYGERIVLYEILEAMKKKSLKTQFPPEYIAMPKGLKSMWAAMYASIAESLGYTLCPEEFGETGMTVMDSQHINLNSHLIGQEPSEEEVLRLNILRKSVLLMAGTEEFKNTLKEDDTKLPVYILENADLAAGLHHKTRRKVNIWLAREEILDAPFEYALMVYMHELTHKYGKDGSKEFAVGLGQSMTGILKLFTANSGSPELREEMQLLRTLWHQSLDRSEQAGKEKVKPEKQHD